ncbi:MAG TPA: LAGLIDADG family homing endonuclease [bacterium]
MPEAVKAAKKSTGESSGATSKARQVQPQQQRGLKVARRWTRSTVHPFDEISWESRSASIANEKGEVVFEQHGVEVPAFWTQLATNVVVSKYFRGTLGTPQRETSVRQLINRVANTITEWGLADGYFASADDAQAFQDELTYLLVHQYASFNSPVWFNVGIEATPQCSACFILSVEDTMESILEWYRNEGMIFKYGSGSGVNVSPLRSARERLKGGGTPSGPVSFMRAADASAGVIKSGGKTRRAAKMVVLNADHPDIKPFILCKWKEEEKAHRLIEAGYDATIDGEAYGSVFFQNANNSVRATDEFMRRAQADEEWDLKAVTTGEIIERLKAKDLLKLIAEATWHCGDPGMQFDTTINDWNTCPNTGRINASNPCFTGDARVYTDKGLIPIKELKERVELGERIRVVTHDAANPERPAATISLTHPTRVWCTGSHEVYRLRFSNGIEVKATATHRFFTRNRGMVPAQDLQPADEVLLLDQPVELSGASAALDLDDAGLFASGWGGRDTKSHRPLVLPRVWTAPLAEYVGYLVGDGSLHEAGGPDDRMSSASVVFGSSEEAEQLLPRFEAVVADTGAPSHLVRMPNGTVQMRVTRTPFVRCLKRLGVAEAKAAEKVVPAAMFQAPRHIMAAFLRGLFTADGCVYNGEQHRYVGLGSRSASLLQGVQQLLLTFGIHSRIYTTEASKASAFRYTAVDGRERVHASHGPAYDLRISSRAIVRFQEQIGFLTQEKQGALDRLVGGHAFYRTDETARLLSMERIGSEPTYNLTEPKNHSYIVNGCIVANCSEYMHVDNSACNLASINLLKFLDEDGNFLIEQFKYAVRIMILAQDIIVDNSSYPTEKIGENARAYRELGLGFANLGALLMSRGLAYDSDEGRAWAGALSALMCGQAYAVSGEIAGQQGPYAGFAKNRDPQIRVLRKHRTQVDKINPRLVPQPLLAAATRAWDESIRLGEASGVRNSQVSVIAPTGTIAFMMDCDTTGIEPDIALVKYKRLVGGGMLKIVNQTVPNALKLLGYTPEQMKEILASLDEQETIEGAPHLAPDHLRVFDCAFRPRNGTRSIHYMGHVRMISAVQPFISGAISKTVNLPEEATVEDIMHAYVEAWRLGIKAIAIYRDGSKRVQPLSTSKTDKPAKGKAAGTPYRRRLADERQSITHKFSIGGHEGYFTVGLFEDGAPGEIFIVMSKEGSTLSGVMDSFATTVSLALQYGVPLKVLVNKFSHVRFEPSGVTHNKDIRFAKSIVDYIFRWMALKFLPAEEAQHFKVTELPGAKPAAGKAKTASGAAPEADESEQVTFVAQADAPACHECGSLMVRNGNCYKCLTCGSTSGCS